MRDLDGRLVVDARDLVERVRDSVVVVRVADRGGAPGGVGGGVIVDARGLVATSLHVIGEARPIEVTLADETTLPVLAVEAWDRELDLAILRVQGDDLPALPLRTEPVADGDPVVVIGNPLGLEHSVSVGVAAGRREVAGRELLQLAAAVEPGSSGGPVLDSAGQVVGLVVMKSTAAEAIAFAAPAGHVGQLLADPHPTPMEDWITIGRLDTDRWETKWGGTWRQRSGRVIADGVGAGFGGRTACVTRLAVPAPPYEVSVEVKLADASGAGGLGVGFDAAGRHLGFYPSAGGLRLTHFAGDDVYSWNILHDDPHAAYRPGEWNRLRVEVYDDRTECFVGGEHVATGPACETPVGPAGLLQFRGTFVEFRRFHLEPIVAGRREQATQFVADLATADLAADRTAILQNLAERPDSPTLVRGEAERLRRRAAALDRLADEVHQQNVCQRLAALLDDEEAEERWSEAALLIALLDDPDVDVEYYLGAIDRLAKRVAEEISDGASEREKLNALIEVMFTQLGFHGGRDDYYHAANSYLNSVIDDREGLPITLSLLFIDLGRRVGLDLAGAPLPGRFLVRWTPADAAEDDVRYVDVFEGGTVLTRGEVRRRLAAGYGAAALIDGAVWGPAGAREIVARMLRNLLNSASSGRRAEDVPRYLDAILSVDPGAKEYRWARAMLYYQAGRVAEATADLDELTADPPPGVDVEQMRRLREALQNSAR